jgi:hypothetical protein
VTFTGIFTGHGPWGAVRDPWEILLVLVRNQMLAGGLNILGESQSGGLPPAASSIMMNLPGDKSGEYNAAIQYKAGYRFIGEAVHAQVLDFPAAITCADSLPDARRLLALALVDVAEAAMETGHALPVPNPLACDPEMDIEEPIYLHLQVSSEVQEVPAGLIVS